MRPVKTMPTWNLNRTWEGEDVYIIGGGPSLRAFRWDLLRGKNTIGCNSAFILGADICKICVFVDYSWWQDIGSKRLHEYSGIAIGYGPEFEKHAAELPEWLHAAAREETHDGLSTEKPVFNGNSGALAINLALILGAKRVFLLGFDMRLEGDRANWHDLRTEEPQACVYPTFCEHLRNVANDLPVKFPGREVINVSDVSKLSVFPMVSVEGHFTEGSA